MPFPQVPMEDFSITSYGKHTCLSKKAFRPQPHRRRFLTASASSCYSRSPDPIYKARHEAEVRRIAEVLWQKRLPTGLAASAAESVSPFMYG